MSGYLKPPTVTISKTDSQPIPVKITGSSLGGGRKRTKPYAEKKKVETKKVKTKYGKNEDDGSEAWT